MPFHPDHPSRPRRPRTPTARHQPSPHLSSPHLPSPHQPSRPQNNGVDDDGPLLYTPAEAADLLRVRESWLRKKAAARVIPCTFLGRHLRFSPTDLTAIVAAAATPATPASRAGRAARATSRRIRRTRSTPRDPDLIGPRMPRVHPPDPHDHNHPDGSSTWPG
jgi:excisionase family DNA binding protein